MFGIYGWIYPTFLIASIKGYYQNLEYKVAAKMVKHSNNIKA